MNADQSKECVGSIGIIGMAGRFPGAPNLAVFWENLCNGRENISFFNDQELLDSGIDPELLKHPNYVKAKAILENAEWFDASFFGYTPKEAEIIDPQHRLFLECAWEALEDAGYDPTRYPNPISVYGGATMNSYLWPNIYANPHFSDFGNAAQISNGSDFLTTRVSYKLNLRGPSINVQTACSTSLVAVAMACQNLLNYQSDMALAGGVSLTFPQKEGYLYEEGSTMSADGHCRPFDSRAQGMLNGEGVGIVLLKRLEDAIADGDQIYAVIKGAAINNDGALKVGYAAPSVEGQMEVITMAQALGGVDPATITYVEAHGTATPLGDPIEIAALTQAFRAKTQARQFCGIGSVKSNIGHLDAAAGIAGLIKTVLALCHKIIPPSLHFERPNPQIDFSRSPFFVVKDRMEWNVDKFPRRAGVSSLGIGGTNAHVVLEEMEEETSIVESRAWQLLLLSARTSSALETMSLNMTNHLKMDQTLSLPDVAFTLQCGRKEFAHRRMIVCSDPQDAVTTLEKGNQTQLATHFYDSAEPRPIVFLFPGQGAQYVNMGKELYEREATFRTHVDQCSLILNAHLGWDLRSVLYPADDRIDEGTKTLQQTYATQPALFVIEYALAKLWQSWGINPHGMLGHSIGEFVAACLAGVFSLEDALSIVCKRGELMQNMPHGSMMAVRLGENEMREFLGSTLSLAAVNGPSACVISGQSDSIKECQQKLEERGIQCRYLHTSHAFHSRMIEPMAKPFLKELKKITLHPPQAPFLSNVTGTWIADHEATDPGYWVKHASHPVRFSDGLRVAYSQSQSILLEVGPGRTLSLLAKQQIPKAGSLDIVTSLRHPSEVESDVRSLLRALGRLWLNGTPINWPGFYRDEKRKRVSLPTYPFARKRYWMEPHLEIEENEQDEIGREPTENSIGIEASLTNYQETSSKEDAMVDSTISNDQETRKAPPPSRQNHIVESLKAILVEVSGWDSEEFDVSGIDTSTSFLELGLDSLMLIQVSQVIQQKYNIKIPFRRLLEDCSTLGTLSSFLNQHLVPDTAPIETSPVTMFSPKQHSEFEPSMTQRIHRKSDSSVGKEGSLALPSSSPPQPGNVLERVIFQQLQIMSQQLDALKGNSQIESASGHPLDSSSQGKQEISLRNSLLTQNEVQDISHKNADFVSKSSADTDQDEKRTFHLFKPVRSNDRVKQKDEELAYLAEFVPRYTRRTQESKKLARKFRPVLADVRGSLGFRMLWKELVYPLTISRASGSKVWDVDGNEYVDLVMGFGVHLLGHSPVCVMDALAEQLREQPQFVGPQSNKVGEVAQLISEFTGAERVTFCNTGSEAVMTAIRLARSVTGKSKIAVFEESYHGNFDSVLVRRSEGKGQRKVVPVSLGIPPSSVQDIVILEYDSVDSLEFLRKHADEFAAVLVEPIQSRCPDLQPKNFLQELRKLTEERGVVLIFDEMITGFRIDQGGAQAWFNVKADLVTYGKVVGGGMPIGIVSGKAELMDAIDGGMWEYGDNSFPQADQTFFAGTFCKHPLALAASYAVLSYLKEQGPGLQQGLNQRATDFVTQLNRSFNDAGVPIEMRSCGSMFLFDHSPEIQSIDLLFYTLMEKGVSLYGNRPYFLSTAHTQEDLDHIIDAVQRSVRDLQKGNLLPKSLKMTETEGVDEAQTDLGQLASSESGSSRQKYIEVVANSGKSNLPENILSSTGQKFIEKIKVPITEAQREVWLACQMSDEASCAYNILFEFPLPGPLNLSILQRSIETIIHRHEALRITFDRDADFQWIHPTMAIKIPIVDLSQENPSSQKSQLALLSECEERQPFDFENGPFLRGRVMKLNEEEYVLILITHHIVCDGWSGNILLDELKTLYFQHDLKAESDLPPAIPFSEYARGQVQRENGPEGAADEAYWISQFQESIPTLELPTDAPRPPVKTSNGQRIINNLEEQLCINLKKLGAKKGCTFYSTLLAGFTAWLSRLTGQPEVVVGIPVAGQALVEEGPLIGHCANLLPLRHHLASDVTVEEHLVNTKATVLDAYQHQCFTFGRLLRKLDISRDPSRLPLVSVIFNVDRANEEIEIDDGDDEEIEQTKHFVNFDLSFNFIQAGSQCQLHCDFNSDLFEDQTILRWLAQFQTLLKEMVKHPGHCLNNLLLLDDKERRQLLFEWNQTSVDFPQACGLHECFEAQVKRTPDSIAVTFNHTNMTYEALDRSSNQISQWLQSHGVRPEVVVGIYMERSLELIIGLLGILKAGGAYLPLDPTYPTERIQLLVEDSKASVLMVSQDFMAQLPKFSGSVLCMEKGLREFKAQDFPPSINELTSENLAYVVYTSGSTGNPKGVQISHRSVMNFLGSMNQKPSLSADDHLLSVTTLSFDISVLELFLPLINGAHLILANRDVATDGNRLLELMNEVQVTVMQATPASWHMLLQAGWAGSSGLNVLSGGEALPKELADELRLKNSEVWNLYGPTEATVWALFHQVQSSESPVPIGRPVANTKIYILDAQLQPVPVGWPGELYIEGPGLARGYLHKQDLTADRFIPNPFSNNFGSRLYKTGDFARYNPDKTVRYLGRRDHQVKVRGYRIELQEIEAQLSTHPLVRQVYVLVQKDEGEKGAFRFTSNTHLVAYVVAQTNEPFNINELREYLLRKVPEYMVPTAFILLTSLPLLSNGKVNQRALPSRDESRPELESSYVPPETETERKLVGLWEEVMEIKPVGIHDNFFTLGGHSLIATSVLARVRVSYHLNLPLRIIFESPTIAELAKHIDLLLWAKGGTKGLEGSSSGENRVVIEL